MKERLQQWHYRWRLIIISVVVIVLAALGQAIAINVNQPPQLDVDAQYTAERLMVTWVIPASLAWDAGIRPGQEIIALNGLPLTSDNDALLKSAQSIQTRTPDGKYLTSSVTEASQIASRWERGFIPLTVTWVSVAIAVFILSTDILAAWALLALAVIGGVTLLTAIATPFGATWVLMLENVALSFIGPSLLCFFLVFPVNRLRHKWMKIIAIVSVASAAFSAMLIIYQSMHNSIMAADIVHVYYRGLIVTCVFCSVILILAELLKRSSMQRDERKALGIVSLGLMAGLLPFCLLSLVPQIIDVNPYFSPDVSILGLIFLPIGLGVAVLSRQFFGIHSIIQRSFIASVVWFVLLAIYAVIINIVLAQPFNSPLLDVAIVASTFPLIQHYSRRWLERRLLADVYDYTATLREMAAMIVTLSDLDEIAQYVLQKITNTMDLQWAMILLTEEETQPLVYTWGNCAINIHDIAAIDFGDSTSPTTVVEAKTLGAHVMPLITDKQKIGVLGLGPKRREPTLTTDDIGLVSTIAPVIAIALRNALLVRVQGQQLEMLGALSGKVMRTQEEIQHQLALELHDEPLQRALLLARNLDENSKHRQEVEEIIASLRAICTELHPPVLDDFGLVPGLERLANTLCARSDIFIDLVVDMTK